MKRFWDKVSKQDDSCWLWTAAKRGGYGIFWSGVKQVNAHCFSYVMHRGEIPTGLFVLHRCDVRGCVNPDHLFLGTKGDNIRDCAQKGRMPRGQDRGGAKLTDEDVRAIRSEHRETGTAMVKLAARYGVADRTLGQIISREKWKHIAEPPASEETP